MNNNENVLNNLMGNSSSQTPQSPNAVPTWSEDEVLITAARVVSIRYKVYIAIIILLIVIVSCSFITPLIDNIKAKNQEMDDIQLKIEEMEAKELEYQRNRELVDQISELDPIIVSCVNEWKWCREVPEILQENDNFSIARSYILLWDMEDNKMEINEKRIIKNIDSFLLKDFWDIDNSDSESMLGTKKEKSQDATESWDKPDSQVDWESNTDEEESEDQDNAVDGENSEDDTQEDHIIKLWDKNGVINRILIWDKQRFNDTLYYVPIELSITFENKDWLLSFINNVEKRVPEETDLRLLYKISKIAYDVVNYEEEQETTINMYLYYYEK